MCPCNHATVQIRFIATECKVITQRFCAHRYLTTQVNQLFADLCGHHMLPVCLTDSCIWLNQHTVAGSTNILNLLNLLELLHLTVSPIPPIYSLEY